VTHRRAFQRADADASNPAQAGIQSPGLARVTDEHLVKREQSDSSRPLTAGTRITDVTRLRRPKSTRPFSCAIPPRTE